MTAISNTNDERLQQIMQAAKAATASTDVATLLTEAVPLLKERLEPLEWQSLEQDLNGFKIADGIAYYEKPPVQKHENGYMPYRAMPHRERPGKLIVIRPDGSHADVKHALSQRSEFIIIAPVATLQQLVQSKEQALTVELPDLTQLIGQQEGGKIALIVERSHIEQIICNTAKGLRALIDLAITPGRREQLEKLREKSTKV